MQEQQERTLASGALTGAGAGAATCMAGLGCAGTEAALCGLHARGGGWDGGG